MPLSDQIHHDSIKVIPRKLQLALNKDRILRNNKLLECPHPCPPFVLHHFIQSLETFRVVVMTDLQVDIVSLRMGDRVPADIRLTEVSSDVRFDRSLLTGER